MVNLGRAEEPVLDLARSAVCLHFVEHKAPQGPRDSDYEYCPVMGSMELDLLSYGFQTRPPFRSRCSPTGRTAIEIVFPDRVEYHSEGRTVTLACPDPVRRAQVVISQTCFPQSGVHVWHMVLTPSEDTAFTEFDIIKLIQLYDGRTERTGLTDKVRFRLPGGGMEDVYGLLRALQPDVGSQAKIRAGTVEILTGSAKHSELISAILTARRTGDREGHSKLTKWMADDCPEKSIILAYCGIVTGILDFDQVDPEEVLDTLEPTFADAAAFLRNHRCTLTGIMEEDRAMEEYWEEVGISPYLIIPHAALLHNEALVEVANAIIDQASSQGDAGKKLPSLERAYEQAEMNLRDLFLPNVFNYITERSLFDKASSGRGLADKLALTQHKLEGLKNRIDLRWEARRDRGQMAIAILLAIIYVFQLQDLVFDVLGKSVPIAIGWGVLGGLAAVTAVLINRFWSMGLRRH